MTEEEKQEPEPEEKQKTMSIEELLSIAKSIEAALSDKYNLSSAEIMFIGTTLQASATTDYLIHNLIKRSEVHVIELQQEKVAFKPGHN